MLSDTGDTGASETMRGWKFLERGRVAPFGGHTWPAPGNGAPGDWIQPPGGEVFASSGQPDARDDVGKNGAARADLPAYGLTERFSRHPVADDTAYQVEQVPGE